MTNIWLEEQTVKGRDDWRGFWAYIDYDEALRQTRNDNKQERKRGHLMRYRITRITLSENVKVVK